MNVFGQIFLSLLSKVLGKIYIKVLHKNWNQSIFYSHIFVWFETLVGQLGPPLWHPLTTSLGMCLTINGNHEVPIEVCSTTKELHMWFYCYCESLPRTVIFIVLWYNICFLEWWILVLSWIVTKGSYTNSFEVGNILQCWFNLAPCICVEWREDLGSLGCYLPRNKWYGTCHKNCIGLIVALVKVECKSKFILQPFQKMSFP